VSEMGIKSLRDFGSGRTTDDNPESVDPSFAEIARNVIMVGDGTVRLRPGYSQVVANIGFRPRRMFDFQREVDSKQFVIVQGGTKIGTILTDGSGGFTQLSNAEVDGDIFEFVDSPHSCYMTSKRHSYTLLDSGGANVLYDLGIDAPATAPALLVSAGGSLSLDFGRDYVVCFVRYWTDAAGVLRYHIGPPSPLSAHTGPVVSGIPTLSNIPVSAQAGVTHKWIFAPADAEDGTTDVYYFAAEITNATTTWADQLDDEDLDDSRLAPWDNEPPPDGATIMVEYENRTVLAGFDSDPDLIVVSAFEEVDLGIARECFPSDLRFRVPGGAKRVVAIAVGDQSCLISTESYWFVVRGFNAETFVKRDKVAQPGAIGQSAVCVTPTHLLYLARDKQAWAWDYVSPPRPFTGTITNDHPDQLSISRLSTEQLPIAELLQYSFAGYLFIILAGATQIEDASGLKDWIQLWDANSFMSGDKGFLAECDMVTADKMSTLALVDDEGEPSVYMADENGNIYRWPDGRNDAGKEIPRGAFAHVMADLGEGDKQFIYADILTNRGDAKRCVQRRIPRPRLSASEWPASR
jgi:hypothetical protein